MPVSIFKTVDKFFVGISFSFKVIFNCFYLLIINMQADLLNQRKSLNVVKCELTGTHRSPALEQVLMSMQRLWPKLQMETSITKA